MKISSATLLLVFMGFLYFNGVSSFFIQVDMSDGSVYYNRMEDGAIPVWIRQRVPPQINNHYSAVMRFDYRELTQAHLEHVGYLPGYEPSPNPDRRKPGMFAKFQNVFFKSQQRSASQQPSTSQQQSTEVRPTAVKILNGAEGYYTASVFETYHGNDSGLKEEYRMWITVKGSVSVLTAKLQKQKTYRKSEIHPAVLAIYEKHLRETGCY